MDLIYPREMDRIFLPVQLDGTIGKVLFEAVHKNHEIQLFWYLDEQYLGETLSEHRMLISAEKGWHLLFLIDENGNELKKRFFIAENN